MGKCHFCENIVDLQNSHIIPECLYDKIYDEKHRFIAITDTNQNQLIINQLGYREKLLCIKCENLFSKWEGVLKKTLVDISNYNSSHLKIEKYSQTFDHVQKIEFIPFKKSILSIIWRMSISNNDYFIGYKLGPYEEKIRTVLKNENVTSFIFPILITKVLVNNKHLNDFFCFILKSI